MIRRRTRRIVSESQISQERQQEEKFATFPQKVRKITGNYRFNLQEKLRLNMHRTRLTKPDNPIIKM